MGALGRFVRSLVPSNDHQLAATQYADRESASDEAARKRRERHRARITREGDNAAKPMPRRYRFHNG